MENNIIPRIVLIACGSFSPPTLSQFAMFEIARSHFEAMGTHEVVGGIVSPMHDAHGKEDLAPANHRCAMVRLALESSDWIRCSEWEIIQHHLICTKEVLQYHQNYLNNYIDSADLQGASPDWLPSGLRYRRDPVHLKLLCDTDLLESFAVPGRWAREDIEDIVGNYGLVVMTCCGSNVEKLVVESDVLTRHQRNISVITGVPKQITSTMVRKLLSRGQSVKYLIDDLILDYIEVNGLFNNMSEPPDN